MCITPSYSDLDFGTYKVMTKMTASMTTAGFNVAYLSLVTLLQMGGGTWNIPLGYWANVNALGH